MKMTKSDLKSLVKECLVELLSEGLGSSLQMPVKSALPTQNSILSSKMRQGQMIQPEARRRPSPTPQLRQAVSSVAKGDKIMESILADTALTTLAEQMAHGDSKALPSSDGSHRGISQQEQINGTPEEIFGEDAASKWANLAFMSSHPK